ncbi:carboxymuconolactone decarboxylase family protein [Methylomonas paludis]|uniref:Carboxymuconolactone decarboxylase family protein n=1 Tax=Methylomonas paludis TaxID=1173101 RepID=A0A975MPJ3_9GAMM|nr:carboxymuconolactone decarboxylase family protein [Methylomonas paludis]QWF71141.1 carboxymuconolactone decarboxylase family protein [Methylomonas paludis]
MSRINIVTTETANTEQLALLQAIQSKLGMVPNFLKVLANSPTALRAFLGLHGIASEGRLSPQTRERIALTVAQQNSCEYCVSAHTALGRKTGLTLSEIECNRLASSEDGKAAVAVKFARPLVEIITHVGMNILTNMIGKASRVEIDFPKVELKMAA